MIQGGRFFLSRRARYAGMLLSANLCGAWVQAFAAGYPPPPGDYPFDETEIIAPQPAGPSGTAQTSPRMLPFAVGQEETHGPFDGATLFGSGRPPAQTRPAGPVREASAPAHTLSAPPTAPAPDLSPGYPDSRASAPTGQASAYPPSGPGYLPHPTAPSSRWESRVPGLESAAPPADPTPRGLGGVPSWSQGAGSAAMPGPGYRTPGSWGDASAGPAYPAQTPAFTAADRPGAVPLTPAPGAPASPATELPHFRPPALDPGY